jgi:hypothetical protein
MILWYNNKNMDFDELPQSSTHFRKAGRVRSVEGAQDPLYEYRLECAERFESLPHRPEFDDALEEFSRAQKVRFFQESPITLEQGDLPHELSDAFYFPNAPTIEAMIVEVTKDPDGHHFIEGSFQVGNMEFSLTPAFPGVYIATDNSEGGELRYKTNEKSLLGLLSVMYARSAAQMLERLYEASLARNQDNPDILEIPFSKPTAHDIQIVINDLVGEGNWENISEVLEKLASAVDAGKTTFTTHALFPPQDGLTADRAILATKIETYHNSMEQREVSLDINWLLTTKNTEFIGRTVHNNNDKVIPSGPSASVQPTEYDIDNFAFMKELDAMAGNETKGKEFSKDDPEWLSLVSIFMTSVQPYLDRHASQYNF